MPKTPVEVLAEIERAFPKNPIDMDRAFSDWGKGYMDVLELADKHDLGSCAARHVGSTPTVLTILQDPQALLSRVWRKL